MCEVKNRVLLNAQIKPELNCRYVDIFVIVRAEDHMTELLLALVHDFVLKFRYEF